MQTGGRCWRSIWKTNSCNLPTVGCLAGLCWIMDTPYQLCKRGCEYESRCYIYTIMQMMWSHAEISFPANAVSPRHNVKHSSTGTYRWKVAVKGNGHYLLCPQMPQGNIRPAVSAFGWWESRQAGVIVFFSCKYQGAHESEVGRQICEQSSLLTPRLHSLLTLAAWHQQLRQSRSYVQKEPSARKAQIYRGN